MRIYCKECFTWIPTSLLKHYREEHPKLYWWAKRLNVQMGRRKR
jgi:hypothetical protein